MLTRRRFLGAASLVAFADGRAFGAPLARTRQLVSVSVSAAALTPDISALPNGSPAVAPWSTFLSATGGKAGWAINVPYTDNTGAVLRRLTNRSTVASTDCLLMEYAEGGPRISQALGSGEYWFTFLVGSSSNKNPYFAKYKLGSGIVAGSLAAQPTITGGNLGSVFSMLPGEENILYLANINSNTIHRYDCSQAAYAPNSVFSGTNASISCGVQSPGWMQSSWDGTMIVFQAPFDNPTAVFALNPQTGVLTSYTGSSTSAIMQIGGTCTSATTTSLTDSSRNWATTPGNGQWDGAAIVMTSGAAKGQSSTVQRSTANTVTFSPALKVAPSARDTYNIYNVNEPHMMKGGSSGAVWLEDNNSACSLPYAWFPGEGVCTAAVGITDNQYGGHSDAGATNLYTLNPNGTYKVLNEYTPGIAPATDGGAWNGTQTDYWGTQAANEPDNSGGHWNSSWAQASAGAYEWSVRDSNGEPYNTNMAAEWLVYSGSIYQASINFGGSSESGRGVVGVLTWNGTVGEGSEITGNLTSVASIAAMTAGTYYWNGTTLYIWMPNGSNPSGAVIISSNALQTARIGYYSQDGSQIRTLCWIYSDTQDVIANYYHNPFVNVSPDGLLVIFNSNLGTYDGYVDLISAEVPTTDTLPSAPSNLTVK